MVRKPTAQQREESAVDVERLLDAYEAKTSDSTAWPFALAEVFDRFPLPSVNMLMALHHPMWSAPEQKLLAYVEATRQDPTDYAEPAAATQTITRIKQTLLPQVRHGPLLIVEARGVARRHELDKLAILIDNQACAGNPIASGDVYSVSWFDQGRRLFASVTPQNLEDTESWCVAIDRNAIGPCSGELRPVPAPGASAAPSKNPAPPLQRYAPVSWDRRSLPERSPSVDYALMVPGLALAVVGFGVAAYARHQVDVHLTRAEGGPNPKCLDGQCSPSGMADVLSARDWRSGYYVAGAAGLLGLGTLVASGHRYYAHWISPSSKNGSQKALHQPMNSVPGVTVSGAGVLIQGHF